MYATEVKQWTVRTMMDRQWMNEEADIISRTLRYSFPNTVIHTALYNQN
jgi:hypothetical protein